MEGEVTMEVFVSGILGLVVTIVSMVICRSMAIKRNRSSTVGLAIGFFGGIILGPIILAMMGQKYGHTSSSSSYSSSSEGCGPGDSYGSSSSCSCDSSCGCHGGGGYGSYGGGG